MNAAHVIPFLLDKFNYKTISNPEIVRGVLSLSPLTHIFRFVDRQMPLGAAAAGSPSTSRALLVIVFPPSRHVSGYKHHRKFEMSTKWGCAPCCSGPGVTVMYDFVNFSRDIAATRFPSVISQVNACISTTLTATVNTHETACPAFKVSLMWKVDVEIVVVAIVRMGMWFMGV